MQIYLTSHNVVADLIALVQDTLAKQQLQDDFSVEVLAPESQEAQRIIESIDPALVTVLVTALGAGGAGTVLINKLARVIEAWINSKKVDAKIEHNGTVIELSGSAGHIEKMLKTILK
jgi:hypothetical protein